MIKILIVEDDVSISKLIHMSLTRSGYHCECAMDGAAAADFVERQHFDLVLLDVMLPEISGFELMEYIRQYEIPVIFLTACSAVSDRIKGLRMGAEDYIVKPFDIGELTARVETVLRRFDKTETDIRIGDIHIDTRSHIVTKGKKTVELTPKEYEMLLLLWQNRGVALYRETIYERVWEEPFLGDTRTVDLHIQRLRKKLDLGGKIQSVYKVGYRLQV